MNKDKKRKQKLRKTKIRIKKIIDVRGIKEQKSKTNTQKKGDEKNYNKLDIIHNAILRLLKLNSGGFNPLYWDEL